MGCSGSKTTAVETPEKVDNKEEIKEAQKGETKAGDFKDYEIEGLNQHNNYRIKHGVPEMTLNRDLCDMAQKYAEHLLEKNLFEHSGKKHRKYKEEYVGENLGYCMGSGYESYDATKNWYDEIKDYNFNEAEFSGKTGHFTQVVWKGSTELGIGVARNPDTKAAIMVGRYYPGGNIVGSFPENVTAPS